MTETKTSQTREALAAVFVSAAVLTSCVFAGVDKTRPAVPKSREGGDLVGTKMAPLALDRWPSETDGKAPDLAGSVVLYRWWTNSCPYCKSSLPAIDELRRRYEGKGLKVVAVYHPKPPRDVKDDAIRKSAERLGFAGPVALDQDWSELKRLYLSTGKRKATSASFLVDRSGVIRFVHPGPDLFPSDDPDESRQDEDYRMLDQAIAAVLAEADDAHKKEKGTKKSARSDR